MAGGSGGVEGTHAAPGTGIPASLGATTQIGITAALVLHPLPGALRLPQASSPLWVEEIGLRTPLSALPAYGIVSAPRAGDGGLLGRTAKITTDKGNGFPLLLYLVLLGASLRLVARRKA